MSIHNGMILITPSSVVKTGASSTATINASGSVTFSACNTLSLNGVFSSEFDNYMIDMRHSNTVDGVDVLVRLRAFGADSTGSNYTYQQLNGNGSTVSGSRTTTTNGAFGLDSTNRSGFTAYVYGPNLAQPTASRSVGASGSSNAYIRDYAWTHSLSTGYDGFTLLYATTDRFTTGLIKVYGLRQ